ncbi:unnamed protein product, partial [Medioppia subpectinata]
PIFNFDQNEEIESLKYPNVWIGVMTSSQLPVNGVKPFEMCGQQLVAFRGATGAVHVLSAYCPHLGANLGVGGHVVTELGDDCIQCPFHGWRFGGADGQCKHIPKIETITIYQVPHDNGIDLEHFGYVHHVLIPNVLTLDFEFDTDYGDGPVPIITGITTLKLFGRKLLRMRTTSRKESPVQEMVSFGYIHVNAVQVPLSHDRTFIIIGLYGVRTVFAMIYFKLFLMFLIGQ